jgi:hypothetical protein
VPRRFNINRLEFITTEITDQYSLVIFSLKVYQQYPEILLRQAMIKIRADQMVTMKKHNLAAIKKYGNYMPMSSAQYQLSINYVHKLQTKWPYNIFKDCYEVFMKLLLSYTEHRNNIFSQEQKEMFNGTEILPVSSGIITIMHDLLAREQIDFEIEMPDQIIMLDARYQGKDETYFRIAQRYQDILTRLYRFKYENVETQVVEISEFETETQEIQENYKKRKRIDENEDLEDLRDLKKPKISCTTENIEIKEQSQECNAIIEKELIQYEEATQENCAKRSSMKRPIDVEENSVDHENLTSKRMRLNSDSIDIEEYEEMNFCEDLEDKIKDISTSGEELKTQKEKCMFYDILL